MTRRTWLKIGTAALGALGLASLAGCTALGAFNAIVPKDMGVRKVIADLPYGPDARQKLDVYRPSDMSRTDLPMIVFFYGGSWNSGDREGYSWVGRALAARGFVVVIPDYRLVPDVRYPAFVEDGAAAVKEAARIAAKIGGDPSRIVLAGHSAGAYNAAMLAYDDRWLGADKARVKGFVGLAGPYDFLPLDNSATVAAFGQTPDLPSTQPINHVGAGDPPAFLATADDDRTVRARNSDHLQAKLEQSGVAVERKRYAGIGHVGILTAISKLLRNRAPVLEDMTAFAHSVTGKSDAAKAMAA